MRDEPLEHLHHHDPVPRDRCAAPVALSSTSTGGTAPMCSNTSSSPSHTHSAFSPGNAHRVPHVRIRKRRHQAVHVRPAPRHHGLRQTEIRLHHARRPLQPPRIPVTGKPDAPCLQRFTYRCTIWYEPSNPCSSTSLSYTRLAVCRCLRGMNRSASNHLPINGLYGSSFETAAGRAGGSGEQSLQLRVLAHRLSGHPDLLRYATPGHTPRAREPDTLLYGRWHRHVLSSRDTCEWLPQLGNLTRRTGQRLSTPTTRSHGQLFTR